MFNPKMTNRTLLLAIYVKCKTEKFIKSETIHSMYFLKGIYAKYRCIRNSHFNVEGGLFWFFPYVCKRSAYTYAKRVFCNFTFTMCYCTYNTNKNLDFSMCCFVRFTLHAYHLYTITTPSNFAHHIISLSRVMHHILKH